MTCEATRAALPLHIEGDLPRRHAEKIRRHLEGCAGCRRCADELRASQRALRAWSPPAVGGAALDDLRRTIWRRIEREPAPSPATRWIERGVVWLRHWAARPSVAFASVCLVLAGSLAVPRLTGLGDRPVLPVMDEGAQAPVAAVPALPSEQPFDEALGAPVPPDPERLLAQATLADVPERPAAAPAAAAAEGDGAQTRIEIQTQDPNVRIIWLASNDTAAAVEN